MIVAVYYDSDNRVRWCGGITDTVSLLTPLLRLEGDAAALIATLEPIGFDVSRIRQYLDSMS